MPDGIIIINKPQDWTSMDVCAKLRGIFHEKRIGHAGTLDPMATGVLPVFVGQATKAVQFAENGQKEYRAVLRLGVTTDTQDTSGTVLQTRSVNASREDVEAALAHFTGEIEQLPPMYSAIKVNGKKLYELARQGREIERKTRRITIFALELLGEAGENEYALRVVCSKGTYIRTLCHDIGEYLGCGGTMRALTRTMAAGFTIEDAVTIEDAAQGGRALLRPVDSLFRGYGSYTIPDTEGERRCRCGNPLRAGDLSDGTYRVYSPGGEFLALSKAKGGTLTAIKNFFGA